MELHSAQVFLQGLPEEDCHEKAEDCSCETCSSGTGNNASDVENCATQQRLDIRERAPCYEVLPDSPATRAPIAPIPAYISSVIHEALKKPPTDALVTVSSITVTREDLEYSIGENWLNDVIVDAYLELIVKQSKDKPESLKVYAFSTFFLKVYSEQAAFNTVAGWTEHVDIFDHDLLLFPVHSDDHWSMAIVNLRYKQIWFLDSLGRQNTALQRSLLQYLEQEMADKLGRSIETDEWDLPIARGLPEQYNSCDCGVFALKYAEYFAQDADMDFTQDDMPYFRDRMMYELLQLRISRTGYG